MVWIRHNLMLSLQSLIRLSVCRNMPLRYRLLGLVCSLVFASGTAPLAVADSSPCWCCTSICNPGGYQDLHFMMDEWAALHDYPPLDSNGWQYSDMPYNIEVGLHWRVSRTGNYLVSTGYVQWITIIPSGPQPYFYFPSAVPLVDIFEDDCRVTGAECGSDPTQCLGFAGMEPYPVGWWPLYGPIYSVMERLGFWQRFDELAPGTASNIVFRYDGTNAIGIAFPAPDSHIGRVPVNRSPWDNHIIWDSIDQPRSSVALFLRLEIVHCEPVYVFEPAWYAGDTWTCVVTPSDAQAFVSNYSVDGSLGGLTEDDIIFSGTDKTIFWSSNNYLLSVKNRYIATTNTNPSFRSLWQ